MRVRKIVICKFNFLQAKIIITFSFDGTNFETAGSAKCDHYVTYGLANYRGKAITTGSWNSGCSVRTELYDFETDQWNDAADYPFAKLVITALELIMQIAFFK